MVIGMGCRQSVGAGVPNIGATVPDVLTGAGGNSGLTPLFVLINQNVNNRLYTTVPQMASAAGAGTLKHGINSRTSARTCRSRPPREGRSPTIGRSRTRP
jgi:hypothetical protein